MGEMLLGGPTSHSAGGHLTSGSWVRRIGIPAVTVNPAFHPLQSLHPLQDQTGPVEIHEARPGGRQLGQFGRFGQRA